IFVTFVLWFGFWIVGKTYQTFAQLKKIPDIKKNLPDWSFTTVNAIHFITPRTADLDVLSTQLISRANLPDGEIKQSKLDLVDSVSWGGSLAVSGVFVALMLGLSCWLFARKHY